MAAAERPTVLTGEGVVFTTDPAARSSIRIIRREAEQQSTFTVPSTEDESIESDVKLLWDDTASSLFVVWHRSGHRVDQIVATQLLADGTWGEVLPLASGSGASRLGLEVVLTHGNAFGVPNTLLHAAWWQIDQATEAEYALVAFEKGRFQSIIVTDLKSLAGVTGADAIEIEAMNEVVHPPLAMARLGENSVEVVFGEEDSTRLVKVTVSPSIRSDARLWRPTRKSIHLTPRAGIQSVTGSPVEAMLHRDRIVLYTPDTKFRYTIYDNVKWSPERMIQLDRDLTSDQLVQELRKTLEQIVTEDEDDGEGQGQGDVVE